MSSTWAGGWCELYFGVPPRHRRPVRPSKAGPAGRAGLRRLSGAASQWHGRGDLFEEPLCPGPSLTARCRGVDARDPVDPDGTRPASFVPWAGPDVRPLTTRSGMLDCVVVV